MPGSPRRRRALAPAASTAAALRPLLALVLVSALALTGCVAAPTTTPAMSAPTSSPTPQEPCAPGATLIDGTPRALQRALDTADPGDVLQLSDAVYAGAFVITRSGTAAAPITLCGTRAAVLDGGGAESGRTALRLAGAAHWVLDGFAVTSAGTGILLDGASSNELRGLDVSHTGAQGIRLRGASSHTTIVDTSVRDTGVVDRADGQGIAVGSAPSTWCRFSHCEADRTDFTLIVGNDVDHTAGEAIRAEAGTASGVIRDNRLSRGDGTDTDAVVDLAGNDWIFAQNQVGDAAGPGVQVHADIPDGGRGNSIRNNTFGGSADEIAIEVRGDAVSATEVGCDNSMTWGPRARSTVPCS